jgi:predicted MFS family arabinose efflux permease
VVTLPVSRAGLVAAGAIFFANFAAYTYIGPLLHTRAGLSAGAITLVLLGFGLAGAAIGSPPAGSAGLAREPGREAPAPSPGAIDTAGNSVPRAR